MIYGKNVWSFFSCFDDPLNLSYSEYVEKPSGHPFLKSPIDKMDYFTSLNLKAERCFFIHTMNMHTGFHNLRNWDTRLKNGKATAQILLNVYT